MMCRSTARCLVRMSRGRAGAGHAGAHLGEWLEHLSWPDLARIDVLLAVHETTSLALHDSSPTSTDPIEISSVVLVQPCARWHRLRIWIRDHVHWSVPTQHQPHDHRHGIGYLRTLADQVVIRRSADGSAAMLLTAPVQAPDRARAVSRE